jgi:hypothetical protein
MTEAYLAALQRETVIWREVETLVREQRNAIIRRDAAVVWDSQEELRETIRRALLAHEETRACQPEARPSEAMATERQAQQAQREARDALRLNHELLKDICSYLDMILEALVPQPLPPAYGPTRLPRPEYGATGSRVA